MDVFYIILLIAGGFLFLFIIAIVYLKKLVRRREEQTLKKFRGQNILKKTSSANFFGIESEGMTQVRGNGVLILTSGELYFRMWVPDREYRIPISSIENVEVTSSHLGRTKFRPLLKVNFRDKMNKPDSVAWLVRDLEDWKKTIQKIKGKEDINFNN